MLQVIVCGNLGADAKLQSASGREFVSFRVAHNDSYTDNSGVQHSSTTWVDCTINGNPKVAEFLKAGTQVCVIGNGSLRVYSSPKDKCMKAGLQVSVRSIELLGGKTDAVPGRLYDINGVEHRVTKFYQTDVKNDTLQSVRGGQFRVDGYGWVTPIGGNDNTQSDSNNPDDMPNVF